MIAKITSKSSFKVSAFYSKCFTTEIECKIELSQEIWKNGIASAPTEALSTQIASLIFLMIYILYIIFCTISPTRNRDPVIIKTPTALFVERF